MLVSLNIAFEEDEFWIYRWPSDNALSLDCFNRALNSLNPGVDRLCNKEICLNSIVNE
jgi:hypothetical protein